MLFHQMPPPVFFVGQHEKTSPRRGIRTCHFTSLLCCCCDVALIQSVAKIEIVGQYDELTALLCPNIYGTARSRKTAIDGWMGPLEGERCDADLTNDTVRILPLPIFGVGWMSGGAIGWREMPIIPRVAEHVVCPSLFDDAHALFK